MRNSPVKRLLVFLLLGIPITYFSAGIAAPELAGQRAKAQKMQKQGNWKEAFEIWERVLVDPDHGGKGAAADLVNAQQCLGNLNLQARFDELVESVVEAHADDWRVLAQAGNLYFGAQHYGFMIGGEFERGGRRGGGKYVSSEQRDRVRALQLYQDAQVKLEEAAVDGEPRDEVGQFYLGYASALLGYRGSSEAWRLQTRSDLDELPDYGEPYYGSRNVGTPVDADGNPVFYPIPASWDEAKNDGERWRWLLTQAAEADPARAVDVAGEWAEFLNRQFGVITLRNGGYGSFFSEGRAGDESGVFELHTLEENETICRLATGIKRITLPDDFNHIVWYKRLAEGLGGQGSDESASDQLPRIFENRRQLPKAVEYWKRSMAEHGPGKRRWRAKQVEQITGNWGRFDGTLTQPAGDPAKVGFVFRNANQVRLSAYRIDTQRLLDDVKKYLEGNPRKLDRDRYDLRSIGHQLVNGSWWKYAGDRVAGWEVGLNPEINHWDRRIDIETPLTKAGAYLVKAELADGNTCKAIVWLSDTAIVKKAMDGKSFYYVADAVSGEPVAGEAVEFFGWRRERLKEERGIVLKRSHDILTKRFSRVTDKDGQIIVGEEEMPKGYQWLTTVKTEGGRLAYLGFESVWYNQRHDEEYQAEKSFAMSDRPVYRPGQVVKYKVWMRHAQYDQEDVSQFAGREAQVRIYDPKGEKVADRKFKGDTFGGFEFEHALPDAATLGAYRVEVVGFQQGGAMQFRVEEYKKPEFEVLVDAPAGPVMLGEEIEATIEAKYLFGAPVANAKVKYKVLRSHHSERWFPEMPWDWFYGSGYWWFASDYSWYPGWSRWGCARPAPWWQPFGNTPPEVVAEEEVEIGADGKVKVKIDTALAKAVHGDIDHRYEITAEVTDESRRTIYGKGSVLVAREPFKVTLWTDRGHYRVGEVISVSGAARTLDGKPVKGDGKLTLYEVSYGDGGQPDEKAVGSWEIDSGDDGRFRQQLEASKMGQYRLSYQLTDRRGNTIEGGYVFVVRGDGFDGEGFHFSALELVTDKREYAPGDMVQLMVNTDRAGAAVALFIRPTNGVYLPPKLLRIEGKSTLVEIPVSQKDMPNFFVEALTVHGGQVYTETREIVVPPEKRVLDVAVLPSDEKYSPGQPAKIKVRLTDSDGKPFVGTTVVSIYDKALEYISGGSNVGDIREFFWKWRRQHRPRTDYNLARRFGPLDAGERNRMLRIGRFGDPMELARSGAGNFGLRSASAFLGGATKDSAVQASYAYASEAPQSQILMDADGAEMEGASNIGRMAKVAPGGRSGGGGASVTEVQPVVRRDFADLALWAGSLSTAEDGTAEVELDMPENLTTWKIKTWGMGHGTKVGAGEAEVITSKDLLIRMQAPRFFVETDEVTLSANVHNYLDRPKDVRVVLEVEGGTLTPNAAESKIRIDAGAEQRVDWRVKAVKEGEALITMKAITDEESDAMQMSYPVLVHGMLKTESYSGAVGPEEVAGEIQITVPAERRVADTVLEIRYSPTFAGAMVDALPYLASYPYGCTEQTLSRFLPTVITQKILLDMGIDLADVKEKRSNLNPQEIGDDKKRAEAWRRYKDNPVWDEEEVAQMVADGVRRLGAMQNSDGGWGWFSGHRESSYPHTTAYVVHGLQIAVENDVALGEGVLENGLKWLERYQAREVAAIKNWGKRNRRPQKKQADNLDAFVFMVLSDGGRDGREMGDLLYRDRNGLALYGKAMFGLALDSLGEDERRDMLIRNIEQFLEVDEENQTAWLRMQNAGYWWYWYGSEYEAQGYYLKLLARTKPKSPQASGLVKYLINNRKHATYWNSTRDTAICIEAIADYMKASKEDSPDLTVELVYDGKVMKEVKIDQSNLFIFDNRLIMRGAAVGTGKHTIELRKSGTGPLYFNAYLTNFTLEDRIAKAGLEIKVERKYYKLVRADKEIDVVGARGQAVGQKVEKFDRVEIRDGEVLESGDLVEVELVAESKNDYEYILFEDPKPAGFEAVDVRSGYRNNGMSAYVEYRNERVALFVRTLARGKHSLSYRLRAEIPGKFSALPTRAGAMYAPELKANSDELKIGVAD
ncbi:MAG: alpha-2-macroglobulin family protein [Verrucomicrobiales bacterium]